MTPSGRSRGKENLNDTMASRAADAVAHAAEVMGKRLDYSVESLWLIDEILTQFHEDLPRGVLKWLGRRANGEEVGAVCEMYGGYIGEIMRTQIGGEWQLPAGGPFAGAPSIAFGDELSSPVLKAHERIMNPDATIPAYFDNMKARW